MNSRRLWNLIRVVVAVSLVLQSVASFFAIPVSAKPAAVETPVTARSAEPFVSPMATPEPLDLAKAEAGLTASEPIAAVISGDKPMAFATSLTLPTYTPPISAALQMVSRTGGRLATADKRVQLEVPAGLFKSATQVKITPRAVDRAVDPHGMLLRFDLDAEETRTKQVLSKFEQPITLTVDVRDMVKWDQTPPGMHLTVLTLADDGTWNEMPNVTMPEYGLLVVPLPHFSQYATGYMAKQWKITYNAPAVSTFSGAGTFNYPIEVPAGRNGLTPQINLSYNSRRVDALMEPGWNSQPPLGMGWSLDTLDIVREDVHGLNWTPPSNWFGDDYSLAVNGSSYHLVPDVAGQNNGFYRAKDAPWLLARRINDCTDDGNCTNRSSGAAPNYSGEYWMVWMGDGTVARLGYSPNAEQRKVTGYSYCPAYCGWGPAYRWRAEVMTDTVGNTIRFTYYEDESTTDQPLMGRSRISKIEYNNSTVPGATTPVYTSRVEFSNSPAVNANMIDRIKVYQAGALVREYRLTIVGYGDPQGTPDVCGQYVAMEEVNSIQQFDAGGASLPATSFTYTMQPHDHTAKQCAHYWYLTSVSNGYGALTALTYLSDGRRNGNWPPTGDAIGMSYRVSQVQTNDGRGNVARVQYDYGTRCYNQWETTTTNGGTICRSPGLVEAKGPLAGHATTTETYYDYDNATVRKKIVHAFNTVDNGAYVGRETQAQIYDGPSTLAVQTDNAYNQLTYGNGVTFGYLQQAATTHYAGTATLVKRVRYEYDTYGNQTRQYDDGNTATTADDRTTQTFYFPTTTALTLGTAGRWIVNKPARSNVCAGIVASGCGTTAVYRTLNYYDGSTNNDASPVNGFVTRVDTGREAEGYHTQTMAYDAWGNQTTVTDPKGNSTVTTYDGSYHFYPVQVTNAKSQAVSIGYNYALGVPIQVTDIDGQVTTMTYDGFGRALKIIRPGDSEALPTTEYRYVMPNGDLHGQQVYRREVSGVGSTTDPTVGTQWTVEWVDGLGRTYQSRTEAGDGTSVVVQDTTYDALGRVVRQSVPYFTTSNGRYATTADTTQAATTTTYDGLDRPLTSVGADTMQTNYRYEIASDNNVPYLIDNLIDASRHRKQYRRDAFGRLTRVLELTGDCSQYGTWGFTCAAPYTTQWAVYATTVYGYDVLDRLTSVQDQAGNVTSMGYNVWGQKTSMSDPDMGSWTYQYDANGNLQQQTDAKPQVLWFNYDVLNRLTEKRQDGPAGAGLATYTYDQGTTGVGQRTAMVDSSGSTSWAYDGRGRVASERKAIGDPQVFEAESGSLSHLTGAAQTSVWLSPASGSQTYLTYGPYQAPAAIGLGQLVSFRLALDTATGANDAVAVLDVYDSTAGQQLTTRTVYRREFQGGLDKFSDFTLTFDTTGRSGHALEYRVYWYGNSRLAHDKTQVYWAPYITSYAYDAMDRATSITYPTGEVVNQTYNPAAQLSSVYGTNTYATGLTYNPLGQIKRIQYGNGQEARYGYFGLDTYAQWGNKFYGRSFQICVIAQNDPNCPNNAASNAKLNLSYWYDNVGNVSDIRDRTNDNQIQWFTYDALDRLTRGYTDYSQGGGTDQGRYDQSFAYNEVGNFLHKNGVAQTYADPAHKHAVTKAGSDIFTYDANGNMLTRQEGSAIYEQVWDSENRVKAVDVAQPPSVQDSFNTLNTSIWTFSCQGATPGCQSIENGTLRNTGTGDNYNGNFYRQTFNLNGGPQGQGVQFEFKVDQSDSLAHFTFEASGSPYRRFGIVAGGNVIYVQYNALGDPGDGSNWVYPATLINPVEVGVWYVLTLKIKPDGQATIEIWRKDEPGKHGAYSIQMPAGLSYRFHHWIYRGNAWLDNYQERNYQSTQFYYDGDGNRVKKIDSTGQATAYIGGLYEKNLNSGKETSYYFAGSQRIAMREATSSGSTVYYFAADHLGSTSLTMDASGTKIGEMKYMPFGETRYTWGGTPTDRHFTGQREENGLGSLYDYGARFYSPVLGRFLSADTIVPDGKNPQAFNRYAYTLNNPVKYTDPSGHYMTPFDQGGGGLLGYGSGGGSDDGTLVNVVWPLMEKMASLVIPYAGYAELARDALVAVQNEDHINTLQASVSLQNGIAQAGLNGLANSQAATASRATDPGGEAGSFYPVQNSGNGTVWVSDGEIDIDTYTPIVQNTKSPVTILTGGHGWPDGKFTRERSFFFDDYDKFGSYPNVSVIDAKRMSPKAVQNIIANDNNTVICAWCFSDRTHFVKKALDQ